MAAIAIKAPGARADKSWMAQGVHRALPVIIAVARLMPEIRSSDSLHNSGTTVHGPQALPGFTELGQFLRELQPLGSIGQRHRSREASKGSRKSSAPLNGLVGDSTP